MTTTPKGLEDLLRARAVKEYKDRLTNAANAFINCTPHMYVKDPLTWLKVDSDGATQELGFFIKKVVEQAVAFYAVEIGDKAVKDFLDKVEEFQGQLDELKDSVGIPSEG